MTLRAVRDALLSRGWEGDAAGAAAAGLEPWSQALEGLSPEQIEGLLRAAPRFGVDLLTGPDWALVSGTRARLSSLARSWSLPPELHDVVVAIGTGLPADAAPLWRAGTTVFDLSNPVILQRLPPDATVFTASLPETALSDLTAALDRALTRGIDAETIAIDPGWAPPLGRFRRFGRPIVCTTADPVRAAIARRDGAQVFVTSAPEGIRRALDLVEHA